jgi:hypothetical protein
MKRIYYGFISPIIILTTMFASCKKFVDSGVPKNQVTSATVFADSADARAAVSGIYVNMMQVGSFNFCAGGMTLYPGLSADELALTGTDANAVPFYNNQLLNNNSNNNTLWIYAYKFMYDANAAIEGLAGATNISATATRSLTGEARFVRAFLYFNLVNLYGGVPVVTGTDYETNRLLGRATVDAVYGQIIDDLKFAQANLTTDASVKERPNYYAATALLAKAYLYTNQYALAASESDKIINSGKFSLVTDLNSVFLAGSNETIWKLLPVVPQKATYEGFYFIPSSATTKPKYIITNTLFNSFESGDIRKTKWIKVNTISGVAYPYPYKYKVATTTVTPTENSVVFRLGEIYLINAEAKINNNDLPGGISSLNAIRTRAGLGNTSAADKISLLLAIEKERQAELFTEWGSRWFDLKRTSRALTVLGTVKLNLTANGTLYPIPVLELSNNPSLIQNPGY